MVENYKRLRLRGLDWLVEKRKDWYLYKANVQPLAVDDRVSVKGEGIGLIRKIGDTEVAITLFNRLVLVVPRKNIVWSDQNWRWETEAAGYTRRVTGAAANILRVS